MENIYVNELKKVITTLNNSKIKADQEIKFAKESYLANIADDKIKTINEKQAKLTEQARESVYVLFNDLKGKLSRVDFPSTEDLSTDRLFFDGTADIDLTMAQIQTFIGRYTSNYTMLKLIAKWIEKNHPTQNGKIDDWTALKNSIPTPQKQLEAYQKIFKSCLSLINSISNSVVSDVIINDFCANDNASFWKVIGNGSYLKEHGMNTYRSQQLPIGADTTFDDITL